MYKLNTFDPYHIILILYKPSVLFYPGFSLIRPSVIALTAFLWSSAVSSFVLLV